MFTQRRLSLIVLFLPFLLFTLLTPSAPRILSQESYQNWRQPAYDEWNSGFSPQNTINRDNVRNLELKWIYNFKEPPELYGAIPPEGIQITPLIFNGIIYIASGYNELTAIVASTGREVWSFQPDLSTYREKPFWAGRLATGSLTIQDGAIYIQTSECSIYGFELTTGEMIFSLIDTCKDIPGNSGQYFGTFAPIFFEDLVITRAQGKDGRGFEALRGSGTVRQK